MNPESAALPVRPLDTASLCGQPGAMIFGSHVVVFSSDADADRAFVADVLGFDYVDAGGGWLIFGLPPAVGLYQPKHAAMVEPT